MVCKEVALYIEVGFLRLYMEVLLKFYVELPVCLLGLGILFLEGGEFLLHLAMEGSKCILHCDWIYLAYFDEVAEIEYGELIVYGLSVVPYVP